MYKNQTLYLFFGEGKYNINNWVNIKCTLPLPTFANIHVYLYICMYIRIYIFNNPNLKVKHIK